MEAGAVPAVFKLPEQPPTLFLDNFLRYINALIFHASVHAYYVPVPIIVTTFKSVATSTSASPPNYVGGFV